MFQGWKKYVWFLVMLAAIFELSYFLIVVRQNHTTIVIKRGINKFPSGFQISEDKTLVIDPGAVLVMGEGAKIEIRGRVVAKGTKENPIIFTSENNVLWRGIEIIGQNGNLDLEGYKQALKTKTFKESEYFKSIKNGNIFDYCHFKNLAAENRGEVVENRVKGAIEANNTVLAVSNSIFANIVHMGCVKTQESLAIVGHNYTDSKTVMKVFHFVRSFHITYDNKLEIPRDERTLWPVGVYTKEGVGIVYGNKIQGFPDNGIDTDNDCLVYIINNKISASHDDGIDVDYNSEAFIIGNEIDSVEDSGIIISEKSKAVLFDNKIINASTGITLRNGGKAIVESTNISECKYGIKLFNQVPMLIARDDFISIKKRLENLDSSYFNYYGGYAIKNNKDAVDLFLSSYNDFNGIFAYNKEVIIQDLTSLFKMIDVFSLKDIKNIPLGISSGDINADLFFNEIKINNSKITESTEKDFLANSFFTAEGCCLKNIQDKNSSNISNMLSEQSIFQSKIDPVENARDMSEYVKSLAEKTDRFLSGLIN